MNLSPEQKIAGVLAPLFALRTETDLGVGDLEGLRQFIDWAAGIGFKIVQLLPINEMGGDHSPYNAISATAIEPTTLHLARESLQDLTAEDLENAHSVVHRNRLRQGPVKYEQVKGLKQALLAKAFSRFDQLGPDAPRVKEFERFCEKEHGWLEDYTLFRWLMDANNATEKWDTWLPHYATREAALLWIEDQDSALKAAVEGRRRRYAYIQWIDDRQWRDIRSYAEERGVGLMGDIPFGVNYYSADVYSHRDQFALDWSGGAPPEPYFKDDEFTQKWGQNWGIPLYRWDVMRARNLDWWRWRVRGVRKIFHAFRIDHVMGFYRIYAFPWRPARNTEMLPLSWEQMRERTGGLAPQFYPRDDSTWENSEANRREGEDYLRVVLEESGDTRVVGEDLGTVPDYVRPSLHSLGIAGFKIPQWEVKHGRVTPGSEYERLSVATYATHDHQPIRAMWEDGHAQAGPERDQARDALCTITQFAGIEPRGDLDYVRDF